MKKITFCLVISLAVAALMATPLTLRQCRDKALLHNRQLKASRQEVLAQESNRKSAFTHFLPRISATGMYQQMNNSFEYKTPDLALPVADAQGNIIIVTDETGNPVLDANGNPIVENWALLPSRKLTVGNTHNYGAAITVTQPLFTGGKVLEQYNISRYEKAIAQQAMELTRQEVLYQTDQHYWQVVSLKEKVRLATQYKATVQAHLEDLQNYRDEGFITDNDLLKAQVKLEQANLKVLQAANGQALASMALNQLIGNDLHASIEVQDSLNTDWEMQEKSINEKSRPELAMLESGIRIAQSMQRANLGRYLPNLAFEGSYVWANPNPYNSLEKEFGSDWTIGVLAEWDIFHWNERGFDAATLSHKKRALEHRISETDELTDLEIQQARQRLDEAEQSVASAKKAVEQASRNLAMYQDRFAEGLATSSDVLDAQTLWLDTNSSLIDAQTQLQLQHTALAKALGTL